MASITELNRSDPISTPPPIQEFRNEKIKKTALYCLAFLAASTAVSLTVGAVLCATSGSGPILFYLVFAGVLFPISFESCHQASKIKPWEDPKKLEQQTLHSDQLVNAELFIKNILQKLFLKKILTTEQYDLFKNFVDTTLNWQHEEDLEEYVELKNNLTKRLVQEDFQQLLGISKHLQAIQEEITRSRTANPDQPLDKKKLNNLRIEANVGRFLQIADHAIHIHRFSQAKEILSNSQKPSKLQILF